MGRFISKVGPVFLLITWIASIIGLSNEVVKVWKSPTIESEEKEIKEE